MNSRNVTVVILAAGLGTRMKSKKAKVLHEAGGDTLLNHVIRAALSVAPPERIVAVVGHQAQQVRESVRVEGVRFAEQTEQKGTGHAAKCAREVVESIPDGMGGQLLILNGDGPLVKAATLQKLVEAGGIVTTKVDDPTGYGRIVRDERGMVAAIVEQKSATPEQLGIKEINTGVYCFAAQPFWKYLSEITADNAAREFYLTDMVEILRRHGNAVAPLPVADETELLGINTKLELAVADRILRERKANELMLAGVTIENPASVSVDVDVEVGSDTVIEANVQLRGKTRVGENCRIGAGSVLRDCEVGEGTTILPYVVAADSHMGSGSSVGPFARLRMHAETGKESHIGNFVELKNAKLGEGVKASHLTYLGDAVIGGGTNIGAGTITCNFDGQKKHRTTIGESVFVGSNSTLVAPLTLGDGSFVAAGSVVTHNVTPDALAIGRSQQSEKVGWAKRRRELAKKDS